MIGAWAGVVGMCAPCPQRVNEYDARMTSRFDGTDPTRSPWSRALTLAWPAAALQALHLVVNLSDRWLAGNSAAGPSADQIALQAAQTTCFYLSWMTAALGVLASAGASALVARRIGGDDRDGANAACHQALLLSLAAGIVGAIVGGGLLDTLLWALQLDGEAGAYARDYLRVTFLLLPVQLVGGTAAASLAAAGDTRTPLWIGVGVMLVNLPLAWIGFRGLGNWPGLGFVGIAWGTGLSQSLGTIVAIGVLAAGRAGLRLTADGLRPDWPLMARLLRISLPAAAESFSMVAGQMVFLAAVNGLGDAARAGHGIALGWETVAETLGLAFGVAANVLVGQNLGAGRPDDARRCGMAAYALGATGMSLVGAAFYTLAVPLFCFFCPHPEQAAIVETGVPVLKLVAFSMPMLASCHILAAALRGAGDTRFPLLFTAAGFFLVRLPLTAWLTGSVIRLPTGTIEGWGLGLYGCWLAMQADIWFRGTLFLVRFARGRWQGTRV